MDKKREHAINSYITDMVALEEHISKAVNAQIETFEKTHPEISAQLREIHATIDRHVRELKMLADTKSGNAVGDAIKQAGSVVAGWGAAAIDVVRNEKLPKDLRDLYTACSLASVGYLMLYTTGKALDSDDTALMAVRCFGDYANIQATLHQLIPIAVIEFLREDGLTPTAGVLDEVHRHVTESWREHAMAVH
jgi:hypothetical protein